MLTRLFIGTTGWGYPDWAGQFYPEDAEPGRYLEIYAEHFQTVEIDRTFHQTPSLGNGGRMAAARAGWVLFRGAGAERR